VLKVKLFFEFIEHFIQTKKSTFTNMNKVYYLQTCDTCKRILREVKTVVSEKIYATFVFQEIKTQPITVAQLEAMYAYTQSYEALFSKRAKKYKQYNLKNQILTEKDYKQYLLEEYTFLKRPVFIVEDEIFFGNSKKTIATLIEKLQLKSK